MTQIGFDSRKEYQESISLFIKIDDKNIATL